MVADELGVEVSQILAKDLFLVNRQKPVIWGLKDEFVSTPKLDDLQCAFVSLKAFLDFKIVIMPLMYMLASIMKKLVQIQNKVQMSTFLYDVLQRVNGCLGKTADEYYQAVARSFLVSCE